MHNVLSVAFEAALSATVWLT